MTEPAIRTFLIADVRGYTGYTVEHGDEAGARLAAAFATLARETVRSYSGEVIELRGDEALAVFTSARQALHAAAALQERFAVESTASGLPLRVGIGLDAGEAIPVEGGFRGAALNLAARLCSLAGPGEILASDSLTHLARKLDGIEYAERGVSHFKGFADPVRVMEIRSARTPADHAQETRESDRLQSLPIGGFLGSLPSAPLVGRAEELARARETVRRAAAGNGQLVTLAGEPGAGKTRLAQEITVAARNGGFLVVAGRCYEGEQTIPYYPFREALAALREISPSSIRMQIPHRWASLEMLLPGASMATESITERDEQQRLFWDVSGFVQALAEEHPVALLLDDLHWSDASSLKLVHHLARQTRDDRVLMVGTYRDVEVSRQHPLEATLRDLTREGLVERIDVRRLDATETRRLVAAAMGEEEVSPEFSNLVYSRTEGNPFFVQQVMRMLVERGDVYREDGRWERKRIEEIEVPESIRSVVGQRLDRLTQGTQIALREASVLGQTFAFDDLLAFSEQNEDELESALEQAMHAGLIRETSGDQYSFDHALTQQSLYTEISLRRRRRLHLAAGDAIERGPERKRAGRSAELAWHFLHGDDAARALRYSVQAGTEAEAVYAHAEAEWHFRTALELAEDLDDQEALARVLHRLGVTLTTSGRATEAIEMLHRSRSLLSHGPDAEAAVVTEIGRACAVVGRANEGIATVQEFIDQADPAPSPPALASLYAQLVQLQFNGGYYARMLETARQAIEIVEHIDDGRIQVVAYRTYALALLCAGQYDEARVANERTVQLAEAVGDLWSWGTASLNLAQDADVRGRFEESLAVLTRVIEPARRLGHPGALSFTMFRVGVVLIALGRWAEAGATLRQAVQIARAAERDWHTPYAVCGLGTLQLLQGDVEEGLLHLQEALDLAAQTRDLQIEAFAGIWLVRWDLLNGQAEQALQRARPISQRMLVENPAEPFPALTQALLANGLINEASDAAALLRTQTEVVTLWRPAALALSAEIAWVGGEWVQAERYLAEALALFPAVQFPFEHGGVLETYGRFHAARGDTPTARQYFEDALHVYRHLGSRPWAEHVERHLLALV